MTTNPDINFQQIADNALSRAQELLFEWIPGGRMNGKEYSVRNPKRPDHKAGSFSVNTHSGVWTDFADDSTPGGSDLISLLAWLENIPQIDAAKQLSQKLGTFTDTPKKLKSVTEWQPQPVAKRDPTVAELRGKIRDSDWMDPTMVWIYKNSEGKSIGAVARFDHDGEKETRPLRWCRNEAGTEKWKQKGFDNPRPLYGMDRLAQNPDSVVCIVEGEKCTDALQSCTDPSELVAISWPGGSKAVDRVDYGPLKNRKIILWPDNDQAGFEAMARINSHVQAECLIVNPDPEWAQKYDVADLLLDTNPETVMKTLATAIPFVEESFTDPEMLEPMYDEPPQVENDYAEPPISDEEPWRALGYDHGMYYYWSRSTKQVIPLTPSQHVEAFLLQFAPLQEWGQLFPDKRKNVDWGAARNKLMAQCHKVGVYNPENLRGVGVWIDNADIIVHHGNALSVGGHHIPLHHHRSQFIYEAGSTAHSQIVPPCLKSDSYELVNILNEFEWENPIHADYVGGWIMASLIGGSLKWRPHMFLTGGAGTGKSYLMNSVIKKILGDFCCQFIGDTSAAGFRQHVGSRSQPVWWDEMEAETPAAQKEIDKVFSALRCASSESSAKIFKGGKDGEAHGFTLHCCAIMSGINVNLTKRADVTRFTVVTLNKPRDVSEEERQENFHVLNQAIIERLTPEFCASLRSRAISMAKVIRANHDVFSRACGELLGARFGDQIGALLAGRFALSSDKILTISEARNWVNERNWDEHRDASEQMDEWDLVNYLMARKVDLDGGRKRTVAELLEIANSVDNLSTYQTGKLNESDVSAKQARDTLGRYGIGVNFRGQAVPQGWVVIANNHPALSELLRETPWARGWKHQLGRIDGAKKLKSWKFASSTLAGTSFNPLKNKDLQELV